MILDHLTLGPWILILNSQWESTFIVDSVIVETLQCLSITISKLFEGLYKDNKRKNWG